MRSSRIWRSGRRGSSRCRVAVSPEQDLPSIATVVHGRPAESDKLGRPALWRVSLVYPRIVCACTQAGLCQPLSGLYSHIKTIPVEAVNLTHPGFCSPTRYSTYYHTLPDPTYEQPPERRHWTMTYCTVELDQRLESPMPTQQLLADQVHVHETTLQFLSQPLPLRQSAMRRSRRSRYILPQLTQPTVSDMESRSPSIRRSGGRAIVCLQ